MLSLFKFESFSKNENCTCQTKYMWPSFTNEKKKRTPVCIYLNALNIPIKYSYTCTVLSNIICSSHERDASITILCYISFLSFNLIVNYVHVSLFLFAALKRTTRGFDAKGNCSARTYEYLTPTFAFAKDYVRHTCCLRKS